MNFDLSAEQELLRRTARDFAEREIAPGASARDEAARFPAELIAKLAELGLLGIYIPQAYGGAGLDALSGAIIIEEIARVDAAIALIVASHNGLCAGHILGFGSEAQKKKYLPAFVEPERRRVSILRVKDKVEKSQVTKLRQRRKSRNAKRIASALGRLAGAARANGNLMPAVLEAARAEATVGEICEVFRQVYGGYRETALI